MLRKSIFLFLSILAVSCAAHAQTTADLSDSESFSSIEDKFFIRLPKASITAKVAPNGAMGPGVTGTTYSCTYDGKFFQIGAAHFPAAIVTDEASYQKFLASAEATAAGMKAKIESKKEIKLDEYRGYEMVVTLPDSRRGISRAFAVGKTLYNVISLFEAKDAETENSARRIMDSFKLISLGTPAGGKPSTGAPAKPAATPTPAASPAAGAPELKKANNRGAEKPLPAEPYDKADVKTMAGLCVSLDSEAGLIELEMFPETAPETVRNFLNLAATGAFDNTTFSRVVPEFVIQGGNLSTGDKWNAQTARRAHRTIPDEPNAVLHEKGIVSMARGDEANSATTDFFILLTSAPSLDGKFAAFGRVKKGMEVVEAINKMPGANEKPDKPVKIKKATVAACGQ